MRVCGGRIRGLRRLDTISSSCLPPKKRFVDASRCPLDDKYFK